MKVQIVLKHVGGKISEKNLVSCLYA